MSESLLGFPHVMAVKEKQRGNVFLVHFHKMILDELHHNRIEMFEESEVGILSRHLMRAVREVSDIKELVFGHLPCLQHVINHITDTEKYAFGLSFL